MSPLRALRETLVQIPQLKVASTQAGFARLVGRSESLVRAVESGRVPISEKFARELAVRFGVSTRWLMKKEVTEMPTIQSEMPNDEWPVGHTTSSDNSDISDDCLVKIRTKLGKRYEPDPRRRIRKKMISSVLIGMDDLFSSCSDEELAAVTSEMREWIYSRLAKMASMEGVGACKASNAEIAEGEVER